MLVMLINNLLDYVIGNILMAPNLFCLICSRKLSIFLFSLTITISFAKVVLLGIDCGFGYLMDG